MAEKSPPRGKKARFSVANVDSASSSRKNSAEAGEISAAAAEHSEEPRSHQNTHNSSGTYNTMYLKSLRNYLTRDVLPAESHYRNILSIGGKDGSERKFSRPTLDELRDENGDAKLQLLPSVKPAKIAEEGADNQTEVLKGKVVKFGWMDGVFMRCLLNIWGVMLFLRLTWVIGQGGIVQGLLVIFLCNVVTTVTAISMSAVSTNGQIKGGGIYYMISRSLGPEFGGAIGIMFTLANSIAVSMYIIGFCDSLLDMLNEYIDQFPGITGVDEASRLNDIRIIGCGTLVLIFVLAVVGMDWVTRVQIGLLGLLIVSQIDFIVGSFLPEDDEKPFGFVGYDAEVFQQNLSPDYHDPDRKEDISFFTLFGVFFPAVTGIVAGANLSGDLRDPATAIPKGTLLAIAVTFVTYIGYGLIIGGVYISQASGNPIEYDNYIHNKTSMLFYNDCEFQLRNASCQFGSSNDQQTMAKISYTGYLIYAGCFAATLSSAIASLVGAPRVLQALAKDRLYPLIGFFDKGYGANNDPFRGYILVFIISLGCIIIGKLDDVSTLLSNFFVAAYALINFSVFHASITKSPGWRPSFRYYNMWLSLIGTVLCVAVMFLMSWITALITFALVAVLYFYISYRQPDANWGSSTQAQQFVSALRGVHTLSEFEEHVKNYRPKILVLTGIPAHRQPLVDFANLLTKKLSLLVCAHVEQNNHYKHLEALKTNVNHWLRDHNIKAFFSVASNESFEEGAISCINLCGLGKLCPNMVMLGFKNNWLSDIDKVPAYINVIHHVMDKHLAIGILRLKNGCDYSTVIGQEEQIIIPDTSDKKDEGSDDGTENNRPEIATTSANLVVEKTSPRKTSVAVYHGIDGNPLEKKIVENITEFQAKKRKGFIDVWWLYDDGGLTLLLPYILKTRAQFSDCSMRVFALANRKDELDRETRNMAGLLAKFRIDFSDVTVIPDITKKASDEIKSEFSTVVQKLDIDDSELTAHKEKTNRHLRLAEMLREHSEGSEMVIMTLPMPRRGTTSPLLYMSWLEIMSRKMPPFLFVRGNQTSVLTFYS